MWLRLEIISQKHMTVIENAAKIIFFNYYLKDDDGYHNLLRNFKEFFNVITICNLCIVNEL